VFIRVPFFFAVAPAYNNCMSQHPDVLILGGGVIGLTVAYSLARENIRVEIVDRDDFGQEASWAGAGIIPPGNPASARTPFDRLRALSSEAFPALSRELRERTGIDNGYLRCGGLVIPEDHEDADDQEWRGEGIRCEELTASEVRLLEPNLAAGSGRALHLPDTAQLRNPRHVKALVAGCASLGVRLRPGCPAVGLVCGDQVTGVTTIEGRLTAGHYVIASGAWSDSLLGQVGWRPGIRPVRGQIALLNTGAPLIRRVLMHGKRYVVPRPDGRVLVGATEEDVGFDKRTTAAAIRDLLDFAISLVPGLADAPLERSWAGLRPGSPDGLPFLGRVPGVANLFVAAGHFRAGIQLSPGTATLMTELILGRPPTIPLDAFRLDR
jgi:glycine oxidase